MTTIKICHFVQPLLYLGVKPKRSLTFCHHFIGIAQKTTSEWAAGAKTLRIAALSLVYSTAEYCPPVWCRSIQTLLINSVLNDALRIVTVCLCPTPTKHFPILSGTQTAEFRQLGVTLSLAYCGSLDLNNILFGLRCSPRVTKI